MSSPTTPNSSINRFERTNYLQVLYSTGSSLNNLASNVVVTGSTFTAFTCAGNTFTAYVLLASGAATSLGGSGSVYWIDWSPDGITYFGTSAGLSGSLAVMGSWNTIQFTGSAPFFRFLLRNQSGSAISGSVYIFGR